MTISYDASYRGWAQGSAHVAPCLTDKFEVVRNIGDGSFGTVALARVRNAGSHVAKRGTMVAIKTMKKTFESFGPCLELREVIFLRTLPNHPHLVPALDIFLDPLTKKLHIAMECMDGNLYQLMKSRDHKPFDGATVKSVLYQIMLGLQHIHDNGFFHRDIKPENILVSLSSKEDLGATFNRYSRMLTQPSGPPSYSIKLADFGLAREIGSEQPYTTYVSTRWYRAPEVLLRSGYYSAPVDIWAMGAMAVEIATLKPLFPGGNEVDQVWRICEIMGNPGTWMTKSGVPVGGGDWPNGHKLAHDLGFSFPKMMPHSLNTVLREPEWPASLCDLITWCLMWDPKNRPTSEECLKHDYFIDAVDPLRPKSASSRLHLSRRASNRSLSSMDQFSDSSETVAKRKSSWLRRSLIARESAPTVTQHVPTPQLEPPKVATTAAGFTEPITIAKRPKAMKRHTVGASTLSSTAPMAILPCIKPISPLPNTISVEAQGTSPTDEFMGTMKLTRQLSMASCTSHQSDARAEIERVLNGYTPVATVTKEGFFSHLRKKARRLSGRYNLPISPREDDIEANASNRWQNNKYPTVGAGYRDTDPSAHPDFADLDKKLQTVKQNLEAAFQAPGHTLPRKPLKKSASNPILNSPSFKWNSQKGRSNTPSPTKSRRALQTPLLCGDIFKAPNEQDEIDMAVGSVHATAQDLDTRYGTTGISAISANSYRYDNETPLLGTAMKNMSVTAPYPSPLPTGVGASAHAGFDSYDRGLDINAPYNHDKHLTSYPFPTPPEESEWARAAEESIFAVGNYWA